MGTVPGVHVGIVRTGEHLLEFIQLEGGEGGAVPASSIGKRRLSRFRLPPLFSLSVIGRAGAVRGVSVE